jgi:hypothetical protein
MKTRNRKLNEKHNTHLADKTAAPHGEGTLCAALQQLAEEGWSPLMNLVQAQAQMGESFILLSRG